MQPEEKVMIEQKNDGNTLANILNLEPKIFETYKKPKPPKTPKAPKGKREVVLEEIWDSIDLNRLAKENITNELTPEKIEEDMLSIIVRQFETKEEIQTALARGLREIVELRALNQLHELFYDSIYESFKKLNEIEKITSPGGRKENMEVKEVAFRIFKEWVKNGNDEKLSRVMFAKLVDEEMASKKGCGPESGNLYMSEKAAGDFLKEMRSFPPIENGQKLVESYPNK